MPQQMMLPTASLKRDPNQPRKTRDPEKQKQLNESVAQHGILQPLGVRDDRITLVWGEGRLVAAMVNGLTQVPAVILDKSMAEWQYHNLQLVENVVRSDISQFDLWQGCVRLMEANPNWGLKDLAKALSYEASAMTRIMSPGKCIPEAIEPFRQGKIVFGHTYAISKAETPEEQMSLLNFCLAGASRDAAEKAVRKNRNNAVSTTRFSQITCPLPSRVVVKVKGSDLNLSDLLEILSGLIKQVRKANDEGQDVKALMAVLKAKSKEKAGKP